MSINLNGENHHLLGLHIVVFTHNKGYLKISSNSNLIPDYAAMRYKYFQVAH